MDKSQKAIFCIGGGIVIYFVLTFLMGLPVLLGNPEAKQVLALLPQFWYMKAGISCLCAILLTWLMDYNLDDISSKKVGQGQHGTARWATDEEIKEAYASLPYGKEFKDLKKLGEKIKNGTAEWTKRFKPGFVIGFKKGRWLVDTSDNNALLTAPPGAGKTKRMFIPTIFYNALVNWLSSGKGASMILTDCKGELVQKCGTFLKFFGYRVWFLNFNNPLASYRFNLMANINVHIDSYKTAETENEKLQHYGRAERYAKILSASIVDNLGDTQKSDSGSYFTETSKGLLHLTGRCWTFGMSLAICPQLRMLIRCYLPHGQEGFVFCCLCSHMGSWKRAIVKQ